MDGDLSLKKHNFDKKIMMVYLKILLISVGIVAFFMLGLGVKMLFNKKNKPQGTCGCSGEGSKEGIGCGCSQLKY